MIEAKQSRRWVGTAARAVLLLAGLSGCGDRTVIVEDLEVAWTLDGANTAAFCAQYGIDHWEVVADGPENARMRVDCADEAWTSGRAFEAIAVGRYTVTVYARTADERNLGQLESTVDVAAAQPVQVTLALFGRVEVIWNINGTNGASDDESWDRCAEVGAAEALVTVDGTSTSVPCEAGGRMAATIGNLKLGAHQVAVKLRNADRADLTTEASAVVRTGTRGGVLIADFFHDSFLDGAAIRGDLIFRTTFEGQLCTATRPPVALQITLLRLNGQAVENAQVCAASGEGVSLCTAVDDRTPRACSAGAQRIANLPWGLYKLKLRGAVSDGSASPAVCWLQEHDVLVGAGTSNPVITLDVVRSSSTEACAPGT
ncbi:MAG: hypothetical protein IPG96_18705 [Proteobacteria bacterium]|nr:hypothetical protein [Pseudomonadota bacterium]